MELELDLVPIWGTCDNMTHNYIFVQNSLGLYQESV